VWEGSGNVICLDVLRAVAREPRSLDAYWEEIDVAAGADARLDAAAATLRDELAAPADVEAQARTLVERLALVFQASLLVRHAPPAVSDAFCASRLGDRSGRAFGTLPSGLDLDPIIERTRPAA
jgi:putative acyl-CoA dehydrogenase